MSPKRAPEPVVPRYITLKEAASYLSLSTKSLYRMVDARTIPFSQINILPRNPDALQCQFVARELVRSVYAAGPEIPERLTPAARYILGS